MFIKTACGLHCIVVWPTASCFTDWSKCRQWRSSLSNDERVTVNRVTLQCCAVTWPCNTAMAVSSFRPAAPSCDIFNLGFIIFECRTHCRASSVYCFRGVYIVKLFFERDNFFLHDGYLIRTLAWPQWKFTENYRTRDRSIVWPLFTCLAAFADVQHVADGRTDTSIAYIQRRTVCWRSTCQFRS